MSALLPPDDQHHLRADARLISRAIKAGWKLSPKMMDSLPAVVEGLIGSGDRDARELVALIRTYMDMMDQNIKLTELELKEEKLEDGRATEAVRYVFDLGSNG